jgi:hypothetical protein
MKTKHEHHKKHEHDRTASKSEPPRFPRFKEFKQIFHSYKEFENAPPLNFSIGGFLQNDAVTIIAGLSDHGKTLIACSIAKALLKGPGRKLWNYFNVLESAPRVIYLIPESTIVPFKHRLQLFNIYHFLEHQRLLVQTLSKGLQPDLKNETLLLAAKGATIFLDSAIRFGEGDENSAAVNQRELATNCFNLLNAGARSVVVLHHSPKDFAHAKEMTLENMLRGTGDKGGFAATGWGIRMLDKESTIIHVQNIKPRDFEPCGPFQIVGRPYIDTRHNFRMHKPPGECGLLKDEMKAIKGNQGGASEKDRKQRADHNEAVAQLLQKYPKATSTELVKLLKDLRIEVSAATVRSYPAWKDRKK